MTAVYPTRMSDILYDAGEHVEMKAIPLDDYNLAISELNKARRWAIQHDEPTDHHMRRHIEWALVALGQNIPD